MSKSTECQYPPNSGGDPPSDIMERRNGNVQDMQHRLANDLDYAALLYAEVAAEDGVDASCERCVFSVEGCSHSARRRLLFGHRRVKQGDADVMLIRIFKEGGGGRWFKCESRYDTAQLQTPYAAALMAESEEEARALVVRYMAMVVVEFSRRVDGAFPASQRGSGL